MQGIRGHKIKKGSRTVKLNMASEKNMRMEEMGNGQQDVREDCSKDKSGDEFDKGERDY